MLNQINKHVNHLFSRKKLFDIEAKEHGVKQTPAQLLQTEKREHNLGKNPTLRQAMEAEFAEHHGATGNIIIKPKAEQRAKATRIYRGK